MFHPIWKSLFSCRTGAPGRRPPRCRPRLETLEDRCVPTILTSFNAATGALTLTGDAGDNALTITESSGATGDYTVAATDGVSGGTTFTGVRSISVNTQGQATATGDLVILVGDAGANSFLTGGLSITGAGGLEIRFQSNFNVVGAVNLSKTTSVGLLLVRTAIGGSVTNLTLGATTITSSNSATTINLQGTNPNDIAIAGALSVSMGGSARHELSLFQVAIAGSVTELGSGAPHFIQLLDTNVGGSVSLNSTAATSGMDVIVSNAKIGSFFSVASGNGNDNVTVNRTSVLGLDLLPGQQPFQVELKGGTNTANIGTGGAGAANVINGGVFYFGAGTETFNFQNYTVNSLVTVIAQAGNSGLTTNITNSKIVGSLSLSAAGSANDNVAISGLIIGQNVGLDLGGGTNTTTITNNTYLGSYQEIDAGDSHVTFTGNSGFGDFTLSGNSLTIASNAFLNDFIGGKAIFTSTGSGTTDAINLGVAIGTAPIASNALTVGKSLKITVGSGTTDAVNVDNVTVGSNLKVTATATGAESVQITNTTVGRNLSVNADASTAAVTVSLGTIGATASTGALRVRGTFTVTTGAGADAVNLEDVTARNTMTITTNAGGDTIRLEGQVGNVGPSLFLGVVTVSTGDENDTIIVGTDANNPARFCAAVVFDGGKGTDTLTETRPQYYGGPPSRIGIP